MIFEMRDKSAAFRYRSDEERRLANGDRLATAFGMAGRVFDGSFDERACRAPAERSTGEVSREADIEAICAVVPGFPRGGCRLEGGNIHTGDFDGCLCTINGFAEEVVGPYGAGDVIAGTIVTPGLVALFGEIYHDFEFGEDVTFDVQGQLGGVRRS